MEYHSEKVKIRPFTKEDVTPRYRSWFNDSETTRHNTHGLFPYTPEQSQAFIAALEGDRSRIIWAIELKTDITDKYSTDFIPGTTAARRVYEWQHVGNVSLQSINLLNRSAELAIVIGEAKARCKGIGLQVCPILRRRLPISRLSGVVRP